MAVTTPAVAAAFADAIVARDVTAATALLHPEVDFRAMTPNRIWEANDPAGVEEVLRAWLEDPDEEVHGVEATEPAAVEATQRVGWCVRVSDAEGMHVFEQQAYVREREGKVGWMRVICSGFNKLPEEPQA